MDNEFVINATRREEFGGGASKRLRRNGKVPAVVYGGAGETLSLVMDQQEVWQHLQHEAFHSHILNLKVEDAQESVILRDVQYHAYRSSALHLDFMRVVAGKALRMTVQIHFTGEEAAVGVKQKGGVISHHTQEVEIECLPKDLPEYLEIDVSELDLDESIHLSDLALPAGVTIPQLESENVQDDVLITIHMPKVVVEESEVEAEAIVAEGDEPAADASEPDLGND